MNSAILTANLKSAADDLGFALAGVCPAARPNGLAHFHEWLERQFDGQMSYLRRRATAYEHPQAVLAGVQSVVVLALPYHTAPPCDPTGGQGRVSRYAWNEHDYHDIIHERLKLLGSRLREWCPEARTRGVVDTAPLLERDLAQLAGLGWIAKNTMLINRKIGSWFFLSALLTDQELEYDQPDAIDHCGTCRACLDACPTQAFPEPYVLDARRCISYLTIELRDAVPVELRSNLGEWVFGCDICQEVCPWNRKGGDGDRKLFAPADGMNPLELSALFDLSDDDFKERFRQTPLWRAKRRGLLRNAALVLGNQQSSQNIPPLVRGLADKEPLVRGACAWALGKIGGIQAKEYLATRRMEEPDAEVRLEIQAALNGTL